MNFPRKTVKSSRLRERKHRAPRGAAYAPAQRGQCYAAIEGLLCVQKRLVRVAVSSQLALAIEGKRSSWWLSRRDEPRGRCLSLPVSEPRIDRDGVERVQERVRDCAR